MQATAQCLPQHRPKRSAPRCNGMSMLRCPRRRDGTCAGSFLSHSACNRVSSDSVTARRLASAGDDFNSPLAMASVRFATSRCSSPMWAEVGL
jgi:hypothetical protein